MITPGELRARLQPIELLKIEKPVPLLDGGEALEPGTIVFAQYIGNGDVILTPITGDMHGYVAKAGVINGVASFVSLEARRRWTA